MLTTPLPTPLAAPLLSANLGAAVSQVAARVRASVTEIHSRGGTGSGTIWSAAGTIVTNHHVTPGESARVVLEDGRTFQARALARDPRNDLAVLKVDAYDLPAAAIGDARTLRPGELVLAVGNPAGVRGAVTVGVVHRALPRSHPGRGRELVQADVLLGPGSSGGPLTDSRGRVVGINAMVSGGMALAVPSHVVSRLLGRQGERPVLGISAQEVPIPAPLASTASSTIGAALDGQPPEMESAMLVMRVEPGSPADRAGLLLGDLLFGIDGHPVEGSAGLLNALDGYLGGLAGPLRLSLLRGGAPRELLVSFAPVPAEPAAAASAPEQELVAA